MRADPLRRWAALAGLLLAMAGAPAAAGLPEIQAWETENGARVLYVHAPEIPIVDVELVFNAAAARDGELPGLARMVSGLLLEGAGGLDADAIAARFDALGAEYGASSLRDMASVSLRALAEEAILDEAVDLLATVVARPDFPPAATERVRAQMQVSLESLRQRPGGIASLTFFEALYSGHPYGQSPYGTEASLAAIGRDDLRAFHQRYYVARNAVVVIVGDATREAAEALAARVTRDLAAGEPAPPLPPAPAGAPGAVDEAHEDEGPQDAGKEAVTVVAHPSTQTHLRLGQPAIRRDSPDYFPLLVGNHALGGNGLVSLLARAVREERGLAYSVSSSFTPMQAPGPYQVRLQTRNDQIAEAVDVVRDTLDAFLAEGPPDEDLALAKDNLVGGFPLRIDSNAQVASHLAVIGFYDLPLDWLATYTERVRAVTAADVRAAFARQLDLGAMHLVLVGDVPAAQRRRVEAILGGGTEVGAAPR